MLNLGQNRRFLGPCDQRIWRMTLKIIGHLFYPTSSCVHYFIANCKFKQGLQSVNAQFELKSSIFGTCDLEIRRTTLKKHWGTSSETPQPLCILSNPSVKSNWSYSPETPILGQNLFWPLRPWPLILTWTVCMDTTFVNGNHSWTFLGNTMTGTLLEGCHWQTDGHKCSQSCLVAKIWPVWKSRIHISGYKTTC